MMALFLGVDVEYCIGCEGGVRTGGGDGYVGGGWRGIGFRVGLMVRFGL